MKAKTDDMLWGKNKRNIAATISFFLLSIMSLFLLFMEFQNEAK
jgi:hypothetical protein